jgi:hypothetical protein
MVRRARRKTGTGPRRDAHMRDRVVDIFDEVEDDLRAERAKRVLRRYGAVIVGAALLVMVAAGGWQAWKWYDARHDAAAATDYIAAMNLADALPPDAPAAARAPAIAAFRHVADIAPAGYRTLARLRMAALQAGGGQDAQAAATWNAVAADGGADPLLRDLANLLWAQQAVDKGDPSLVEVRLRALAAPGNAWHQLAEEYLALLYIRTGKPDLARETLRVLAADPTAPQGLRGRADGLLDRLGS